MNTEWSSVVTIIFLVSLVVVVSLQSLTFYLLTKLKLFMDAIRHSVNSDRDNMLAKIELLQKILLASNRDNATLTERNRVHQESDAIREKELLI
jgi:hypothetical protein